MKKIKIKYVYIAIYITYLILFPFQIFPPGNLQLADYVLLIGGAPFIIKKDNYKESYIKWLSYFILYSLIIGIFYALVYFDATFIKNPINYLYCLVVLLFFNYGLNRFNLSNVTTISLFITLIFQLLSFFILGVNKELIRITIWFNNPNQLGFWAFITFSLSIYQYLHNKGFYKLISLLSAILSTLFVVMSISQAAIISCAILLFAVLIIYYTRFSLIVFFSFLIIGSFVVNSFYKASDEFLLISNLEQRITNEIEEDDGDNNLEGRGYTRLYKYPQYLLLGSGEGLNNRFNDQNEIHSSFANILFSYGTLGFLFVIIAFFELYKNSNKIQLFILISLIIFTLVHNLIRWPLFYVLPLLIDKLYKTKSE